MTPFFYLATGILLLGFAANDLIKGRTWLKRFEFSRESTPIRYWAVVVMQILVAAAAFAGAEQHWEVQ